MSEITTKTTTKTYYVTKYALTQGIWEVPPGSAHFFQNQEYLYVGRPSIQVTKKDFFETLEQAEQRVEQLKETKLRSLEKAMKKLKSYKAKVEIVKNPHGEE